MAGKALTYSFKFPGKDIETTITDNHDNIEVLIKAVGETPTQVLIKKRKAEDGDVTIVVYGDTEHESPTQTLSREGDLVSDDAEAEEIFRVDLKVAREARTELAEERVDALERECENLALESKSKDEKIRALNGSALKTEWELANAKRETEHYKKMFYSALS